MCCIAFKRKRRKGLKNVGIDILLDVIAEVTAKWNQGTQMLSSLLLETS